MTALYKLLEEFTEEYLEPACSNLAEFAFECIQLIGSAILIGILFFTVPVWYVPFIIYKSKHK